MVRSAIQHRPLLSLQSDISISCVSARKVLNGVTTVRVGLWCPDEGLAFLSDCGSVLRHLPAPPGPCGPGGWCGSSGRLHAVSALACPGLRPLRYLYCKP